jgi:hypothetical protein
LDFIRNSRFENNEAFFEESLVKNFLYVKQLSKIFSFVIDTFTNLKVEGGLYSLELIFSWIGSDYIRIPLHCPFKGIVSRDFDILFLFHWIDLKVVLWPDQAYFPFK